MILLWGERPTAAAAADDDDDDDGDDDDDDDGRSEPLLTDTVKEENDRKPLMNGLFKVNDMFVNSCFTVNKHKA